jgi:hypothetical protein
MFETRRHPKWNDILSVTITKRTQAASGHPNWNGTFTMSGPRLAPEGAIRLVAHLQTNSIWNETASLKAGLASRY